MKTQEIFCEMKILVTFITILFLFFGSTTNAQDWQTKYDSIRNLTKEICLVQKDGNWSLNYKKDGETAFRKIFQDIKIYKYHHSKYDRMYKILAVRDEQGKVGMLDEQANLLIPIVYDSIFQDGLIIYAKKAKKWSLFNLWGRTAFPFELDEIYPRKTKHFNGHIIKKGNYYGLIDKYLNIYFEPIYDSIFVWENYPYINYVQASIKGEWGLFSMENGKLDQILSHRYDNFSLHSWTGAYYTREHHIQIGKNGQYGLWYSKKDSIVLPVKYDRIVQYYRKDKHTVLQVSKEGKKGLFDTKEQQVVLALEYDEIEHIDPYRKLLCLVQGKKKGLFSLANNKNILPCVYDSINTKGQGSFIIVQQASKYGLYQTQTKLNTGCIYDRVFPYKNKGAYFVEKEGKIGLLDMEGTKIIPCIYDEIGDLNTSFIVAKLNAKPGVINAENYKFIDLSSYEEAKLDKSYIFVRKDKKWGLLGKEGQLQIDLLYDQINWTKGKWFIAQKEDKFGVIDHYNKTLISFNYTALSATSSHESWLVKKQQKFGIISKSEEVLVDFKYDELHDFYYQQKEYAIAKIKKKYGLIDFGANVLIKFKYQYIAPFTDAKGVFFALIVKKGKNVGLMDLKGELLMPFKYEDIEVVKGNFIRCIDKKGTVEYYTLEDGEIKKGRE